MMGLVHSVQQLYCAAVRAADWRRRYFPGVALVPDVWFRQREQAQCIALFLTACLQAT